MARLDGKVALITGAGSGIGLAGEELFAREGAKLVLVGRNEQALQTAVDRIGADRASAVVADVSRPEDKGMMRNIEEGRSPGAPEKARSTVLANLPMKRYGIPAEVANLMLLLASDDASLCTGGVYSAEGGLSASWAGEWYPAVGLSSAKTITSMGQS